MNNKHNLNPQAIQNKGSILLEKILANKEKEIQKVLSKIDAMNNEEIIQKLKEKNIPTYGTPFERKERLKKAHCFLNRNSFNENK